MRQIFLLGIVGLLAGCVTVDTPKGTTDLFGYVDSRKANAVNLITDIKLLNSNLLFLSAGDYSCGEAEDPELQAVLGIRDAKKQVEQRYNGEKAFTAAYEAFQQYGAALAMFGSKDGDAAAAKVKTATSLLLKVIEMAGGTAPAAVTAVSSGVLLTATKDFVDFIRRREAVAAVRAAQPALAAQAVVLKREYSKLSGQEQQLFHYWDSCALETLYFIRDLPRGKVSGFTDKNYFGPSSAQDLLALRSAYLEKRARLAPGNEAEWNALVDAVVKESEAFVKSGGMKGSLDNLVSAVKKVEQYKTEVDAIGAAK